MSGRRGHSVAIIGAGLSGLTAGWTLREAGLDARVFERASRPGGRTMSIRQDGFVFDVGAITMLPSYARTLALTDALGIGQHLHRVQPIIGIPRQGRIHGLDLARPIRSLLTTKLISTRSKFRLLGLLPSLRKSWGLSDFQSLSKLSPWDEESIFDRVGRLCGAEIRDFIAGPIIRGNTLNAIRRAPFGELLWMLRQYGAPYLYGFDQGINFLAETLASRLPVVFDTPVSAVENTDAGVILRGGRDDRLLGVFDACVIALPPKDLLALAPILTGRQRNFLDSVTPLQSVSLHVGLRKKPTLRETFILPPESEQDMLTAIVMDHAKAPGRAPEGKGAVSFFMSQDWSEANFGQPDKAVRDEILAMAAPFMGWVDGDVESWVVQRWPYAIIRSEVGLYRRIGEYEADIDIDNPIQIAGDFLSMGMEAAVISGENAARNLTALLARLPLRAQTPAQHSAEHFA